MAPRGGHPYFRLPPAPALHGMQQSRQWARRCRLQAKAEARGQPGGQSLLSRDSESEGFRPRSSPDASPCLGCAYAPSRVWRAARRTPPLRWSLARQCRPSDACRMTFGRKIAGVAGTAAVVYRAWVRPRLMRWGATGEEVAGPYPGADLVPDGERGATMAVTIDAPPDQVWPWLVQLGGDRGGWYSWDHLDNAGRPSAQRVHPEWQDIALGDYVKYWTRRHGPVDAWQVAALEPNRFLGLHGLSDLRGRSLDPKQPRPSAYTEGLWGFLLNELPGGRTRLVIGGYQAFRPRWLGRVPRLLALLPGCLDHAGTNVGRTQAKRRTSGPAEGLVSLRSEHVPGSERRTDIPR